MPRLLSILFWSIISAAFIGPGTVTTAASAGASYGYALLWALVFSTIATLVLQEASARLAIVSGLNLGQAIRQQFREGVRAWLVLFLVVGAIIFGCAAYEAGNILGGVAGAAQGTGLSVNTLTLILGAVAGMVLWLGTPRGVAYLLSGLVAFMGLAFLLTAVLLRPPVTDLLRGSLAPTLPAASGLLVLGLIGTTVVPYNLFLGSGIARGQTLGELRFGLTISIVLGGLISMGVLVVGAAVTGAFSYEALADTLSGRLGNWAGTFFAFGLCAAGLSSAITAPMAAAITARSLFESESSNAWHVHGWRYRGVWLGVLLVGVGFGLSGVRPIPAIILAQALNGIVLPFVAVFLLLVINDRAFMGAQTMNGALSNSIMCVVTAVTVVLGVTNVTKAAAAAFDMALPEERTVLLMSAAVTSILAVPVAWGIRRRRNRAGSADEKGSVGR